MSVTKLHQSTEHFRIYIRRDTELQIQDRDANLKCISSTSFIRISHLLTNVEGANNERQKLLSIS